jgi:hypothetical protein
LLPIEDAQDFEGWTQGTNNNLREQGVAEGSGQNDDDDEYGRHAKVGRIEKIRKEYNKKYHIHH